MKSPIRKRSSLILIQDQKILGFWAIDPVSKKRYFFLPGGALESNEMAWQAAERETLEETGWVAKADPSSEILKSYDFTWNGTTYRCETYFYYGQLVQKLGDPLNEPSYHQGCDWISLSLLKETFSYHATILSAIEEVIEQSYHQDNS